MIPQQGKQFLPYLGIALSAILLYTPYLDSSLFFDDFGIILNDDPTYWDATNFLKLRWFPYASLHWTLAIFGDDLIWLRAGNLFLHVATCCTLYAFLRRLFDVACAEHSPTQHNAAFSNEWTAFFGALLFTVHPIATYGVAYLVQRSILIATLFSILTWLLFLEGVLRRNLICIIASGVAYLFATLGKEHAILAPSVSFAMLALIYTPGKTTLRLIYLAAIIYASVAGFVLFQYKLGNILNITEIVGQAYEPIAGELMAALGIPLTDAHPLSILTQSFLFFKYQLLWFFPNPSAMSIAMEQDFAPRYLSLPYLIGPFLFVSYMGTSGYLLIRRGRVGLLGFAMLTPGLLFIPEFSVVRIQEIFVLYRSYLWMPCIGCALPFILYRFPRRTTSIVLALLFLAMITLSTHRLNIFADKLALWNEALTLAKDPQNKKSLGRIYHNRGLAYVDRGRYDEALDDFSNAIRLLPRSSDVYNDRAVAFLEKRRYSDAISNYNFSIMLDPNSPLPYHGRARVRQALGQLREAREDLMRACTLGRKQACEELHRL